MDYFDEYSEEKPVQFRAGEADFAPRSQQAPWHEDPRAMFRTVAGLAGAPGLAQAGIGMLGGMARAIDPAERMFRGAMGAGGMLGMGAAQADGAAGRGMDAERQRALENQLRDIEELRADKQRMDRLSNEQLQQIHMRRLELLRELGKPAVYQRQAGGGMLDQLAARPSGAGERRDKKLRDAEDRSMG